MIIVKHYTEVERKVVEGATGTRIRWLIGKELNPPNFYMRMFELDEGGATPYHEHNWEHEIFVLEGQGAIKDADGNLIPLEPGKFALVPPNLKHQFVNTGKGTFRFLCIIPKVEY